MARDLVDINQSGELTSIQIGGETLEKRVVVQDVMEAYVAQAISEIPVDPGGGDGLTNPVYTIDYDPQNNQPGQNTIGRLWYDNTKGCLSLQNNVHDYEHKIGSCTQMRVFNDTGSLIGTGFACKWTGTTGAYQIPTVALAQADTAANAKVLGVASYDIPDQTFGFVMLNGIADLWDNRWNGEHVYLSDSYAGQITNVAPTIAVLIGLRVSDFQMALDIRNIIP